MNKIFHRWTNSGLAVLVHDEATHDAIWEQLPEYPRDGDELVLFSKWARCSPEDTIDIMDILDKGVYTDEAVGRYFISKDEATKKYIDQIIEGAWDALEKPILFMGIELPCYGRLPLDLETMESVVFNNVTVCDAVRHVCKRQLKVEYDKYKAVADAIKDLFPPL